MRSQKRNHFQGRNQEDRLNSRILTLTQTFQGRHNNKRLIKVCEQYPLFFIGTKAKVKTQSKIINLLQDLNQGAKVSLAEKCL